MSILQAAQLSINIDECIRILSEKFRKWPYNFFTESDAHSYLYYSFFRYGNRAIKITYPSKNPLERTVLVHREYPTFFRYSQKALEKRYALNEPFGTCGHYDMVVLNPSFVENHDIQAVISKDNKIRQTIKYGDFHLLAAIEFKLLHKPLGQALKDEIKKDFVKLNWALETRQSRDAYLLIFNRYGMEKNYWKELAGLESLYPRVRLIYQESYYSNKDHKTFIKSCLNRKPALSTPSL